MSQRFLIEERASEYLETLPEGEFISTRQLATALDSSELGQPYRIENVLCQLANNALSDCADHGEPVLGKSGFTRTRTVRPWHWHRSKIDRGSLAEPCGSARAVAERSEHKPNLGGWTKTSPKYSSSTIDSASRQACSDFERGFEAGLKFARLIDMFEKTRQTKQKIIASVND